LTGNKNPRRFRFGHVLSIVGAEWIAPLAGVWFDFRSGFVDGRVEPLCFFELRLIGTDATFHPLDSSSERSVMRAKSLVLLMIAVGCGVVASVAVSQVVLDQKGQPSVQTVGIILANKNISAAAKITADSFRIEQWPTDRVPQGAILDKALVENKFAKQPIYANEPIIEMKLAKKGKEIIIPDGYRVFDIVVRDEAGGSGYIAPGDKVDVFGFFEKCQRISASKSVKVLENIEVLMVDGVASVDLEATDTVKKSVSTIQLLVKDKQYSVLDTASHLGKLRLALRPPDKSGQVSTQIDDGEAFMEWLNEAERGTKSELMVSTTAAPVPELTKMPPPAPDSDHEMMIISPENVNRFKWKIGEDMPRKVEVPTAENAGNSNSGVQSGYQPVTATYPTSGSAQSSQANMTWDPYSGTWQYGGNKATPSSGK
jgi:pilus assembly protein CpaB